MTSIEESRGFFKYLMVKYVMIFVTVGRECVASLKSRESLFWFPHKGTNLPHGRMAHKFRREDLRTPVNNACVASPLTPQTGRGNE